jgi:hypothetical protein
MLLRWLVPAVAAGLLLTAGPASACPLCNPTGTTLASEVAQADFILYGSLSNAQRDPKDEGFSKGTTDMTIDLVIKPHDMVKGKKAITIPRYVPPDSKNAKYLIFFRVVDGQIDPYRGEPFPADSKLPDYIKGALDARQKDTPTRLRYFFDHLEDPEIAISADAYNEFAVADYKEVHEVAPKLPPEVLLKWLKDPNTRGSRFGLYGLLLGHCGKAADAKAVRELLDDKERSFTSGLDGILVGYALLDPKAGWDYLIQLVKSPDAEFPVKYAALKTARFFWEFRSDIVPHTKVLDAIKILMDQPDIADMPIEDVRKWKAWDLTPTVLGYAGKETHNTIPIVNRAVLKFAIAAAWSDPKNTAAAEFVRQAREKDKKRVEFLEELLRDELKPAPASPPKSDPPKPQK